jgi:hypothetical protein
VELIKRYKAIFYSCFKMDSSLSASFDQLAVSGNCYHHIGMRVDDIGSTLPFIEVCSM